MPTKKQFIFSILTMITPYCALDSVAKVATVSTTASSPVQTVTTYAQPVQTVTTQMQQPATTVVTTKAVAPQGAPEQVQTREGDITDTAVKIKNNSNDAMHFALAAIHTTMEQTPMFSRAYNAYVTQSLVSELVELGPQQTMTTPLSVDEEGKKILLREKTFGIIVIAIKRTSEEEIKRVCAAGPKSVAPDGEIVLSQNPADGRPVSSVGRDGITKIIGYTNLSSNPSDGQPVAVNDNEGRVVVVGYSKRSLDFSFVNVCQVFEDELTVTEHTATWISNPKMRKVFFKMGPTIGSAMGDINVFTFPADFIFDKTEDRKYTTPNYQRIIDNMKAVEKKYNKLIFPSHYFQIEVLKQLPLKELSNVSTYANNMLTKPLPITQATLSTLLDCGKYNGIAIALVKIVMSVVLAITGGGGAFSLIQDMVSGGMEIGAQAKDIKARG